MDIETTVGHEHRSWVPDHLCQALQDQCCSQAAKMGPVSISGLSACLSNVCVIRDSVQCAEAACDHWHALDSLPSPGLFPRTLPQDRGPAVRICGVCVCPPVNVLKFLFYKVVCLK